MINLSEKWPLGTPVRLLKVGESDETLYPTAEWAEYDADERLYHKSVPIYWECEGVLDRPGLKEGDCLRIACTSQNGQPVDQGMHTSIVQSIRDIHPNMVEFDTLNSTYALMRLEPKDVSP